LELFSFFCIPSSSQTPSVYSYLITDLYLVAFFLSLFLPLFRLILVSLFLSFLLLLFFSFPFSLPTFFLLFSYSFPYAFPFFFTPLFLTIFLLFFFSSSFPTTLTSPFRPIFPFFSSVLLGICLSDVCGEYCGNLLVWPGTHTILHRYVRMYFQNFTSYIGNLRYVNKILMLLFIVVGRSLFIVRIFKNLCFHTQDTRHTYTPMPRTSYPCTHVHTHKHAPTHTYTHYTHICIAGCSI
jgi:hypothetical protein